MRPVRRWLAAGAAIAALFATAASGAAQDKQDKQDDKDKKESADFVKVAGYVQLDGRFYLAADARAFADTFVVRRARIIAQGTVARYFDFCVMPDFANSTLTLYDAYLDAHYVPWLGVRAGKFRTPVDLERLQSAQVITFVERGYPSNVAPNRDVGVEVHGEVAQGVVDWAAGVFNGVVDGTLGDSDANDGKDVAARLFVQPFMRRGPSGLKGIGIGLAGTSGQEAGAVPSFKTSGQQTFFSYLADVTAAGSRTRLEPQASYQKGPFRAIGDYIRSRQHLAKGSGAAVEVTHSAWLVSASVVLTGETPASGAVTPKHPFEPATHGGGALELAARFTSLEVGLDAFRAGLADSAKAAGRARAWAVGLNWYLNRNVKQVVDFERTTFTGGAEGGDRAPENVILIRSQISF